jgi:MFS family permease
LLQAQGRRIRGLFSALKGNARVIVVTEGVAAISFQWYGTYLPLYMLALGVDKVQVGVLASVLIATKLVSTLLGGYLADRLGRKRVLVVFDILCWGVPMFLYAIAQNPVYFFLGRLINGLVYVVLPSFECLFVEDVPVERRTAVFGALQFLQAVARLLAPVAGLLVAWLGIVPAGRLIMVICMVSSVTIAIVRQFTMRETTMGRERMSTVAGVPVWTLLREYAATLRTAVRDRRLRTFLIVRNLGMFVTTMWTTYSVIYLTDERGVALAESSVALLPFVSALATIAVILLATERLRTERVYGNLLVGQVLWLVAALFYVLAPARTIGFVVLWAIGSALSTALYRPAAQSYWAGVVPDRERAQVFAASSALMALVALPAGPLAGAAYTLTPRGPFWLAIALQLVALGLILSLGKKQNRQRITRKDRK